MLTGAILLVLLIGLTALTYLVLEHGRYWKPRNLWLCRLAAYPLLTGALILAAVLTFTGRALAAEASPTAVDFRPLWGYGVELLIAALGVLGTWLISRLSAWLGLRQGDSMRSYVDDAFIRALQYAAEKALAQGKNLAAVNVRSELVAVAAKYAVETVPDALRHFGIDGPGLEKRLLARLPEVVPHPAQPVAFGTPLDAP